MQRRRMYLTRISGSGASWRDKHEHVAIVPDIALSKEHGISPTTMTNITKEVDGTVECNVEGRR